MHQVGHDLTWDVATGRLSTRFNEIIQADLLFIFDLVFQHIVDEATRWSGVQELASRNERDVLDGFVTGWINIWGPPLVLIMDQESAFACDAGQVFCESHSIQLNAHSLSTGIMKSCDKLVIDYVNS